MSDHSREIERLKRIATRMQMQAPPPKKLDLWCQCGAPATTAVSRLDGTTFWCKEHVPEI